MPDLGVDIYIPRDLVIQLPQRKKWASFLSLKKHVASNPISCNLRLHMIFRFTRRVTMYFFLSLLKKLWYRH